MIVKYCGIKREEDIRVVNELKPDLVGFVLDPTRKRYVAPSVIASLRRDLSDGIRVVGVFVDEDPAAVAGLLRDGIIDIAQLHGHESEDYIKELKSLTGATVIKAFGIRNDDDIKACDASPADLVIVDSPGGGTGESFDWELLKKINRPYILAGGLNAGNIERAVEMLAPYGVDVSSGIETDGLKDEEKMRAFMALARKDEQK